jgi:hypothetical protein
MLLMDEIHIQPYMNFKGGNIVGNSFNNSSLATAAYTFMIFSITSNFKEVIHIQGGPTLTIPATTRFLIIEKNLRLAGKTHTLWSYKPVPLFYLLSIGFRVKRR